MYNTKASDAAAPLGDGDGGVVEFEMVEEVEVFEGRGQGCGGDGGHETRGIKRGAGWRGTRKRGKARAARATQGRRDDRKHAGAEEDEMLITRLVHY